MMFPGVQNLLNKLIEEKLQQKTPQYQMQQEALKQAVQDRIRQDMFRSEISRAENVEDILKATAYYQGNVVPYTQHLEKESVLKKGQEALATGDFSTARMLGFDIPLQPSEKVAEAEALEPIKTRELERETEAAIKLRKAPTTSYSYSKKLGEPTAEEVPFRLTEKGTNLSFKYMDRAEKFTKDYQTVQANLMNIVGAIDRLEKMPKSKENRLAVNQAVITSFNKITDPTSVVRESEYERTPRGAPLLHRLRAAYEKIGKGGVLTNEDIRELKYTARAIAEVRRNIINEKLEKLIRQPAKERGLNPEEIAPLFEEVGQKSVQTTEQFPTDYTDADIDAHLNRLKGIENARVPQSTETTRTY